MIIPIVGHVKLLFLLWDIAGRDAWLSSIFAAPFGVFIAYLTWKLMNIRQDETLTDTSITLFGKVGGSILNSIWFLYFFFQAILTTAAVTDFFQAGFYQETPMWFLALCFIPVVAYGLIKGIHVITWTAAIYTFIIMISGHAISFLLSDEREWGNLLPMFEYGITPSLAGTVLLCAVWSEFFALAVIQFKKKKSKGMLLVLVISALSNSIMSLSVAAGGPSVFGLEQVDNMTYPILSSVRMVSLGFIDRFDVYGLSLMTWGCFIRVAFYFHVASECLPKKLKKTHRTKMIITGSLLLYIIALIMFMNKLQFSTVIRYYVYGIFLWILPFLYLFRARFISGKTKRNEQKPLKAQANES